MCESRSALVRIKTTYLGQRKSIKVNECDSMAMIIRKINLDVIDIINSFSFNLLTKQLIKNCADLSKEIKSVINSKRFELKITKNICGGTSSSFPSDIQVERKKCVIYDDFHSCAKLECDCWISFEGVRNFVQNAINDGMPLICKGCDKLLDDTQGILDLCSYNDYKKEDKYFDILEKKLRVYNKKENILTDLGDAECPHCKTINRRVTLIEYRMKCAECNKLFCYDCEDPWKSSNKVVCGNKDCTTMYIQDDLEKCGPLIINDKHGSWVKDFNNKFSGDDDSKKIPRFRACIGCWNISTVISNCRHITCDNCKTQYCYVCLKPWKGHDGNLCDRTPPAPTQKLI